MKDCDCGLFGVTKFDCWQVLVLTIGGTGIPLLIFILSLLCIICCICRRLRKYRKESYDIAKTKEANGSSKIVDTANLDGVQMTEVAYVEDEDMAGPLYDSVIEIKRIPVAIAIDDVDSKLEAISEEHIAQPYEEFPSATKRLDLPEYAKPDKTWKVSGNSSARPVSKIEQLLFANKEDSSTRDSMSLLPEGLYSSIGDITAPPLPPPLATENVPFEIRLSLENLDAEPEEDGRGKRGGSMNVTDGDTSLFYTNVTYGKSEQNLAKGGKRESSLAVTDGDNPFYTNVTLKLHNNHEQLISSKEDEVEIKQDLYVNF